ncbi:MAG: Fic family protein [Candidatus Woesearchaeota archaeon]
MNKITIKKIKGKEYAYLEKSIRIGAAVRKVSKYLGPNNKVTKNKIIQSEKEFDKELFNKEVNLHINKILDEINKLEYPLNKEEVKKIEEMNLKYKRIMHNLHEKDLEDLNKRFIANYVFESNAIEGSSLTLKNVVEVVFEDRISQGKDLREIYEAQNSYKVFLFLKSSRVKINNELIIKIHAMLMDKIDNRLGYRKVPMELLGNPLAKLSSPEEVEEDLNNLLKWFEKSENNLYPLELAFKFHAKFEKIHPFSDGNGRVGRFLLNYILIKKGYFPIIIRKNTRNNYIKSLEAADRGKWIVLMRFALNHYKNTFRKFYEIYYQHVS